MEAINKKKGKEKNYPEFYQLLASTVLGTHLLTGVRTQEDALTSP